MKNNPSSSTQQLSSEKIIEDASKLAAKAFLKTTSYIQVFRIQNNEILFEQMLQIIFRKNIAIIYESVPESLYYQYETNESGEEIMICFFMLVPKEVKMTWWQKIRHGLLWLPIEIGWMPFIRLLAASDYFDSKLEALFQGRDGFRVERMVVHPNYQGKGIGSQLLGKALREVADVKKLPVVLSTQDPRNVIFYSRL